MGPVVGVTWHAEGFGQYAGMSEEGAYTGAWRVGLGCRNQGGGADARLDAGTRGQGCTSTWGAYSKDTAPVGPQSRTGASPWTQGSPRPAHEAACQPHPPSGLRPRV